MFLRSPQGSFSTTTWIQLYCKWKSTFISFHGPLARYVKLGVAHVPGMPRTFPSPPRVSDPDMHQGTCVTHVPWCMPGSLTSGFLWSRWRGKRSRHSRRMRNPQFYVSGKRPIGCHSYHLHEPWINTIFNIILWTVTDARLKYCRVHIPFDASIGNWMCIVY